MTDVIEEIYQGLIEGSSDSVKAKLKILKKACESQVTGKSTDFSFGVIGKISKEMGGPAESTIKNKSKLSPLYQSLVMVYRARYSKPVPKKARNSEPLRLANCIEDTVTRLMVLDLISTNRKLQNELNLQKSKGLIELDHRKNTPQEDFVALENKLTSGEVNALTSFISENKLKDLGWKLGEHGRIVDVKGKPVTKPFFIDAINKLSFIPEED